VIISVASGKGGTGKTLVATSLALSLRGEGVEFMDCDVEEPNAFLFLKPRILHRRKVFIPVPSVDEGKCDFCGECSRVCSFGAIAVLPGKVLTFPELCHGCGACSTLCPRGAIKETPREIGVVERGEADGIRFVQGILNLGEPMPTPVIREVKKEMGGRITVIDVSPGTSCPMVEAVRGSDFSILVTEPTPLGLYDLSLAVEVLGKLGVPFGVVLNKDGMGFSGVEDFLKEREIPLLLRIPFRKEIAMLYSKGVPLVEGMPEWRESFLSLYEEIKRRAG